MVPVSTRHTDEHGTLGNRVSAVFADLPIGLADPLDRLHAVTAQLHALKNSGTALGVDALLGAADLLPGSLLALGVKTWAHSPQRTFSTVTTNVPGPRTPLYLLGRRMTDLYPYIPLGRTCGSRSASRRMPAGSLGASPVTTTPSPTSRCSPTGSSSSLTELISLTPPSNRSEARHA